MTEVVEPLRTDYSSISLHRKCPQAWWYRYERGLDTPREGNIPARDFGSWWHALQAADSLERGRAADSLLRLPRRVRVEEIKFDPKTVTVDEVQWAALDWWNALGEERQEPWVTYLGMSLPDRLDYIFEEWCRIYAEQHEREVPLLVEQWWDRTVQGVKIGGYVDEVLLDRQRKTIVVRDNKSKKDLGTQSALDDMMDSQLQLYAWGIAPMVKEAGSVRAVSYDRVAAVAPKTPVMTAGGSLSKSVTKFDLRTYQEFVGDGIPWGEPDSYYVSGKRKGEPKFGVYTQDPKEIERLSTPAAQSAWFQRTMVPINLNIIKAHLQAAIDSAQDQGRTREQANERGFAARNLSTDSCRWCDYRDLCRAELMGGPGSEYDPAEFGLVESRKR